MKEIKLCSPCSRETLKLMGRTWSSSSCNHLTWVKIAEPDTGSVRDPRLSCSAPPSLSSETCLVPGLHQPHCVVGVSRFWSMQKQNLARIEKVWFHRWITENLNHRDENTEVPVCCALLIPPSSIRSLKRLPFRSPPLVLPHHWHWGCSKSCHSEQLCDTEVPPVFYREFLFYYRKLREACFRWVSHPSYSFPVGFMYSSHNYQQSCSRVFGEFLTNHLSNRSWQRELEILNLGMLWPISAGDWTFLF